MPNGKEIVNVVVGETGARGDIKIWRSQREEWSDGQKFQGNQAYLEELVIDNPPKKTRNQDITCEHKKENQQKGRKRIVVEHLIRLVKI
jgi:hypothetical protein